MDLEALAAKLTDDQELEFAGEKIKAADLKSYLTTAKTERERLAADVNRFKTEAETVAKRFQDFEGGTSALLKEAARLAADDGSTSRPAALSPAADDDGFSEYEKDPLFGPFTKKYGKRVLADVKREVLEPFVNTELTPLLKQMRQTNEQQAALLFDERQRREFREAGDWPENFDLESARKYGRERNYFVPGSVKVLPDGRQAGLVDLRRVHDEVMEPIRRNKWETEIKTKAEQEAMERLRANYQIIPIPNREMTGGGPKRVVAKGRTADEIIGNSMNEAMKDADTVRRLQALADEGAAYGVR
jgi:hypothetical protein